MVNGDIISANSNPFILSDFDPTVSYDLQVRANCGTDGYSSWSYPAQYTPDPLLCAPEDKCGIRFELHDSFGDGWNGNTIEVIDVATNDIITNLTIDEGNSNTETILLCDGQEIGFEWVQGLYYNETSYEVYDANAVVLFSGSAGGGLPTSTYTVNCPTCRIPIDITAQYTGGTEAVLHWVSNATAWDIMVNGTVISNVSTNPYTLSSLDPSSPYEVKMRSVCGPGEYSNWSPPVIFSTCSPEDQCSISYSLFSNQGTGWNGNAIQVVDASNQTVLDTWTFDYGEAFFDSVDVCDGQVINFVWVEGQSPIGTRYEVFDGNNEYLFLGESGYGIPSSYTVNCAVTTCQQPVSVDYDFIDNTTVSVGWASSANSFDLKVNGDIITDVDSNSYVLTNLEPDAVYEVQVRANCGDDEYSIWSIPLVIKTECLPENQCEIHYYLHSPMETANTGIIATDVSTGYWIGEANLEGQLELSGAITVCDGQEIRFFWNSYDPQYDFMIAYEFYDLNNELIFSGNGGNGILPSYTVNCAVAPCQIPGGVTIDYSEGTTAEVYWESDATSFEVKINGTTHSVVDTLYKLTNLEPNTAYEVQVRANCGDDGYSNWSNPVVFRTACAAENQCMIHYDLHSTVEYGWPGYIKVEDVATHSILDSWTFNEGYAYSGNLPVCDGQELSFTWVNLYGAEYDEYVSYEMYDAEGTMVFNGNAGNGLPTSYIVNCPACQIPVDVAVDLYGTSAEVYWTSEASSFDLMINGNMITHVDSDYYVLSNLALDTTYEVQVRANCGTDGYSNWSSPVQFTTPTCQQCEMYYSLHDSYGDGWNGCAIQVMDAQTGEEIEVWTIYNGNSMNGTLSLCQGREIRFVWAEGNYINETSYEVYDYNGDLIFSGGAGNGIVPSYLVDCSPCHAPIDLAVNYQGGTTAEVSWDADASSFDIMVNGAVVATVDTNYYLLSNLALGTAYEVKVRANCGADGYSIWTAPASFNTDFCMPEDRCEIYYELYSGYGWYDNAIQVIDVQTNQVIATWTMTNGEEVSGSLHVCQGQELRFNWLDGDCCPNETSYEIYDYDHELIFSGSAGSGLLSSYVVSCVPVLCDRPEDLAVASLSSNSASVTWISDSDATYNLRYRESVPATIILNVGNTNPWGGYGCQLLLDADATIDPTANNNDPVYVYGFCEYKIPVYADGAVSTTSVVADSSSMTIQVPPGIYDWCVTIPNSYGISILASADDYLLESGKTYEFTVTGGEGGIDEPIKGIVNKNGVDIVVTGGETSTSPGVNTWTIANNVTPPYTINSLTDNTCYEVQIQAICNGTNESFWSPSLFLNTPEVCPMPILSYSNVTSTSAEVSWTAFEGQNSWQICLNGDENNLQTVNTDSYTLTGLTEMTSYAVKVRVNCGSGGFSEWSNEVHFTTSQSPASLPYETSFENGCDWVLVNGNNPNVWTWGVATSNSGKKALYISNDGGESNTYNPYGDYSTVYATKTFTFDADVYNISFDWRAYGDYYNDYLSVFLTTEDKVLIPDYYSLDPTYDNDVLRLVENQELRGVEDWQTKDIEINIPVAGTYKIVFRWRNNDYDGQQHPAAIDNVSIKRVTCITPDSLAYSDLTAESVNLSWSAPATQTSWDICLNNDEENLITATSNPFTLTGLSELTAYSVKIRANCGSEDGYSNWTDPISFKPFRYRLTFRIIPHLKILAIGCSRMAPILMPGVGEHKQTIQMEVQKLSISPTMVEPVGIIMEAALLRYMLRKHSTLKQATIIFRLIMWCMAKAVVTMSEPSWCLHL